MDGDLDDAEVEIACGRAASGPTRLATLGVLPRDRRRAARRRGVRRRLRRPLRGAPRRRAHGARARARVHSRHRLPIAWAVAATIAAVSVVGWVAVTHARSRSPRPSPRHARPATVRAAQRPAAGRSARLPARAPRVFADDPDPGRSVPACAPRPRSAPMLVRSVTAIDCEPK